MKDLDNTCILPSNYFKQYVAAPQDEDWDLLIFMIPPHLNIYYITFSFTIGYF